jgi:hypothetical protein
MKRKSNFISFLSNSAEYEYSIISTVDTMHYFLVLFSLHD